MQQTVVHADCLTYLRTMPPESVRVVFTSPPYNLGIKYATYNDNLSLDVYLAGQRAVAAEIARVLRPDGRVFLVVGSNSKFPWRSVEVAQAWGTALTLQQTIVWAKSLALDASSLPERSLREALHERTFGHFVSLTSKKFLNPCHEIIWHFTKHGDTEIDRLAIGVRYVFENQPERFGHGRAVHCRGSLWHVPTPTVQSNEDRFEHPATFPVALAELGIKLSGAKGDDLVLDPFAGTGSTLLVAQRCGLRGIGIEMDGKYCEAARERLRQAAMEPTLLL